MSEEDVNLKESIKTASYTTLAVLTPVIALYSASEFGIFPFEFSLPLSVQMIIMSVFLVFNLTFAISVLDHWRK